MKKRAINFCLCLLVFFAASASLEAWVAPIVVASEKGKIYEDRVSVQFHPSGIVYLAFVAHDEALMRKDVYLYKYSGSGSTGEFVKKVSEGKKYCYEPDMVITRDGTVHIVWAESVSGTSDQQAIMYRSLQNGNWSPVITLKDLNIPGILDTAGFNKEKIDDLNVDVDNSGNVFFTFMIWPAARCKIFSKYGNEVNEIGFPLGGRSKHPSVSVFDDYVHVTWQQMLSSAYTIYYARRPNTPGSAWESIDVKGGAHRPVMDLDQNGNAHIAYMMDDKDGRSIVYKYWMGNKFSNRWTLSETIQKYQNVETAVKDDKTMIVVSAVFKMGITDFIYNWKNNGNWQVDGMKPVPGIQGKFDNTSVAISSNNIGGFSYNNPNAVFLILSEPLLINEMPVAVLNVDKDSIFWGEEINFTSNGSSDSDGTIVKYEWKIIQDNVTLEGPSITYKFNKNYNNVRVRLTVIDDKEGRGIAEKVINVTALYTPVSTVSKQQIRTLVFNREGNVINWQPNAKNDAAGYIIVKYKISRMEAGGSFEEIGEVGAEKRSFADVNVEAGKTYFYAVSAVDDQGHMSPYDNF
jgi:hypothetical protein